MPLDDGSRPEEFTRVTRILVHDARGDLPVAFEMRARIEVVALTTGVEFRIAL